MRRVLNSVDSTFNGARQELNASKDWMGEKPSVRLTEYMFVLLSPNFVSCCCPPLFLPAMMGIPVRGLYRVSVARLYLLLKGIFVSECSLASVTENTITFYYE
jgi:hypothetical protein